MSRPAVLPALFLTLGLALTGPATAQSAAEAEATPEIETVEEGVLLLMAEEEGCIWCARWNEQVGDAYGKTAEGRAAPLLRYDIRMGPPEGIDLARAAVFTPTFVLVRDGVELSRIEGYPGEDFFWGLLGRMLDDAGIDRVDPVAPDDATAAADG